MFGTYLPEDVTILLKDITGLVEPLSTEERERRIQNGMHYSEMLPIEYKPTADYLDIYNLSLKAFSDITAEAVGNVSRKILADKGKDVVLVSLARAGTPIGILIKRYLKQFFDVSPEHYSISIIRGVGIDPVAMQFILDRHDGKQIQFIDGWTGKGAIQNELNKAMEAYSTVDPGLAVLSDPANIAKISGTNEDFLIASSCLNATVSGLLSRTFNRNDIIKPGDFHGAVFYKELIPEDVTYQFIDTIVSHFKAPDEIGNSNPIIGNNYKGIDEAKDICNEFGIDDINLVKPSIVETTRVLLRRVPWKVLVYSLDDEKNLGHIYQLAREKNVPVELYPLRLYKACGLIKSMADQ